MIKLHSLFRRITPCQLPKRKPLSSQAITPDKPLPKPKKWIPFSPSDSRAIEAAFQAQAEEDDVAELRKVVAGSTTSLHQNPNPKKATKVPVNEDYLFDVDIETRELAPSYWLGPVYDVKRGTWFTPDGEAVDESLATQLEEGYLKVKPWRFGKTDEKRSASQPRSRPISMGPNIGDDHRKELGRLNRDSTSNPITPKSSFDSLKKEAINQDRSNSKESSPTTPNAPAQSSRTYRLFGAYMNSTVTYQDEKTAWLLSDDAWTRMGSTLYERFAGGAHYAGYRYTRGYTDPKVKPKIPDATKDSEKQADRPVTPSMAYGSDNGKTSASEGNSDAETTDNEARAESPSQTRKRNLERQVSQLMTSSKPEYEKKQEEEMRKREEKEMRDDYKAEDKGEQGREIEHLLLITHGIGQRLGK